MSKTPEEFAAISTAQAQHYMVSHEAYQETNEQLTKWGVQNHPMGTGPEVELLRGREWCDLDYATGAELEGIFRDRTDRKAKNGTLTYWDILLEEVFEAGAEDDPVKLEAELIQVAAVAISAVATSRRARGA